MKHQREGEKEGNYKGCCKAFCVIRKAVAKLFALHANVKNDENSSKVNYRPVSNLSNISKYMNQSCLNKCPNILKLFYIKINVAGQQFSVQHCLLTVLKNIHRSLIKKKKHFVHFSQICQRLLTTSSMIFSLPESFLGVLQGSVLGLLLFNILFLNDEQ